MFKIKSLTKQIRHHLFLSAALVPLCGIASAQEAEKKADEEEDVVEVISVRGVRSSLRDAAFLKKNADQILDAISAEDIGQLPDNNIAEALQRVTGVQINRDETGQGSGFQVRGLTQNRVEINGQDMGSSSDSRSNSFNAVDSSLFSRIEVIKSPTADMVEGASGATVRLHTFKPLDFKKTTVNLSGQGTRDDLAEDNGHKFSLMGTSKFDLDSWGEIGFLINTSAETSYRDSHSYFSNWAPMIENQIAHSPQAAGKTIFRPDNIFIDQKPFQDDRMSFDSAIQWRPNSDLEFSVSAIRMELDRANTKQGINFRTNSDKNYFLDRDLDGTVIDESPSILTGWSRNPVDNELIVINPDEVAAGAAPEYAPYNGMLDRYFVQTGTVTPVGNLYNPPVSVGFDSNEDSEVQESFQFGMEYQITDNLLMNAVYAFASSEREAERYSMNMGAGVIQQRVDEEILNQEEASVNLSSVNVYYDYASPGDLPTVGVVVDDGSVEAMKNALLNPDIYTVTGLGGNREYHQNKKDSLALDFDYFVDGDFLTKVEFGARLANNNVNRRRNELEYNSPNSFSITSDNWRAYDQDLTTETMLGGNIGWSNPTIAWTDQVFEEHYGVNNYLSRFLNPVTNTFAGNGGETLPGWLGSTMSHNDLAQFIGDMFPGRSGGNCTLYDKDNQRICTDRMEYPVGDETPENWREYNYLLDIPAATYLADQDYPYLIEETTKAIYFKANFENVIFDLPFSGNIGVRYVETEVSSLGMNKTRIVDEDTWRPLDDFDTRNATNYTPVSYEGSYANVLPSFNFNLLLTENMFLRFAYSKTMTRPNPVDLSPTFSVPTFGFSGNRGNPQLKPEKASNYDLSWEWYQSDVNQFSAAIYYKELKDFLTDSFTNYISPTDRNLNGLFDDPVTIRQPVNGDEGSVQGVELAATHTFEYLPGFLSGFGVQTNYTFTDSSQAAGYNELDGSVLPIKDLSENSANLILFYDKYGFNFRAAYNYRDESFVSLSSAGPEPILYESFTDVTGATDYRQKSVSVPVWNDEFATLDLSMSYRFNGVTVFLQATNVLDEPRRSYVGDVDNTKHLLRQLNQTGPYYTLGIRARFD
ncbi:TonB-dependent receptor [Alteromonas aestuariivivens]|uniref:TonB-dependent receptor n=1 Tax=Alteromonas aestuariivivens TaxID=1938339 RepID=A0A3D8M8E3_9ALTE|nr:TonB-dependent receptor [Alteromonas aestuariivivens]RDV26084.1 TonB-dependent receptor [Alteromonas aestuariivivens]